jgi:hypothetical protein
MVIGLQTAARINYPTDGAMIMEGREESTMEGGQESTIGWNKHFNNAFREVLLEIRL